MAVKNWFPTSIYCAPLARASGKRLAAELLKECRQIRDFDDAGLRWSQKNYPGGYTSYGSLDKLHKFSSTFAELERRINRHVLAFARALDFDLNGRELVMTDCWINIMPRQVAHSFHLHPLSTISGTYYVRVPRGAPGLRFEDPRLSKFMAAPPRCDGCREENRNHVTYAARAGNVILFESWLRHEVPANITNGERVSVSFNYNWF